MWRGDHLASSHLRSPSALRCLCPWGVEGPCSAALVPGAAQRVSERVCGGSIAARARGGCDVEGREDWSGDRSAAWWPWRSPEGRVRPLPPVGTRAGVEGTQEAVTVTHGVKCRPSGERHVGRNVSPCLRRLRSQADAPLAQGARSGWGVCNTCVAVRTGPAPGSSGGLRDVALTHAACPRDPGAGVSAGTFPQFPGPACPHLGI